MKNNEINLSSSLSSLPVCGSISGFSGSVGRMSPSSGGVGGSGGVGSSGGMNTTASRNNVVSVFRSVFFMGIPPKYSLFSKGCRKSIPLKIL